MTVFEFLIEQEKRVPTLWFQRDGRNMQVSMVGYNPCALMEVDECLRKDFKLRYNCDKGISGYDQQCGRTFYYYKDVYDNDN